jgi:predicted transcriptional regulator of viral defense system
MVKNNTMTGLGPKETQIIARLSYEKATVVTVRQLESLFGGSVLVRQIIYQLKKKGILKPITKGVYYYSPLEAGPAGIRINEFLIPPILFAKGNYYVGYSNMYNFYGFTDQIFQTMYVLNTSLQREREIGGISFKLLKIPPTRMYGLDKVKIRDTEVIVSDRERTLVDLVFFPDPAGGLKKAFDILKKEVVSGKADIQKLIRYTLSFPVKSVQKRIGFVLDECLEDKRPLVPLEKKLNKTSLIPLYGSKSRKGKINNKWRVIIDAA